MLFFSYGSRPLLSRSGCISSYGFKQIKIMEGILVPFYRGAVVFICDVMIDDIREMFSSPFIEERLYFFG